MVADYCNGKIRTAPHCVRRPMGTIASKAICADVETPDRIERHHDHAERKFHPVGRCYLDASS
jgi:hypothetical protein